MPPANALRPQAVVVYQRVVSSATEALCRREKGRKMEYFKEIYRVFLIGEGRLLIYIFGGVLLLILGGFLAERLRIARSPLRTATASVVQIEEQVSRTRDVGGGPGRMHSISVTYRITFRMEDGELVKLMVPGLSAQCIRAGDRGRLTWRGPAYLAFDQE